MQHERSYHKMFAAKGVACIHQQAIRGRFWVRFSLVGRAMLHPYTGELCECRELDGSRHDCFSLGTARKLDVCEYCGDSVIVCMKCLVCASCCSCGAYHSVDCDWPL